MLTEPVRDLLAGDTCDPVIDERIAILEQLGGIAGVTALTVENAEASDGEWCMLVSFHGWSPGLHAIDVTVVMTIRDDAERIIEGLAGTVSRQRSRQRLARRLGITAPLEDVIEDEPEEAGDLCAVTRHLLVDRDLLAITQEDDGWTLHDGLGSGMPNTSNKPDYDGGAVCEEDGIWVMDTPAGPLAGAVYHLEDGSGISFDGRHIALHGVDLPDLVLTASVGRTVFDIVDTHPLLGPRMVTDAWVIRDCDGTTTVLAVDPIPVPLHPESWTNGEEA